MCPETLTIIQTLAPCVLALMSVLALGGAFLHVRELKKSKKMDNWCVLMEFLHRSEFRNARMKILDPVEAYILDNRTAWKICSSFDFAGSMVKNKLVDKNLFFEYWKPVLELLEKDKGFQDFLNKARFPLAKFGEQKPWKNYWEHFNDLFAALEEWKEKRKHRRKEKV